MDHIAHTGELFSLLGLGGLAVHHGLLGAGAWAAAHPAWAAGGAAGGAFGAHHIYNHPLWPWRESHMQEVYGRRPEPWKTDKYFSNLRKQYK